jgi:L-arabinose isomerase
MGDFQVAEESLEQDLGIQVDSISPQDLLEDVLAVSEEDLEEEMAGDGVAFRIETEKEVLRRGNRLGLGLRRYLERNGYHAFSLNFLSFDYPEGPLGTVPFLECSKAMARGVGYAGEGDVLTASLVGALQSVFGQTTFTEIFCPDWEGESLFLSHMGEINPEIAAAQPRLYEKEFDFTPTQNPPVISCAIRSGRATLVNLAPAAGGNFNLIAARVEVLEDGTHPDLENWIRGWIRPEVPMARFLEIYSEQYGGTHHNALMMGDRMKALEAFARMAGFRFCSIAPERNIA